MKRFRVENLEDLTVCGWRTMCSAWGMGSIRTFHDLVAWQRCSELCEAVFDITSGLRDSDYQQQIRRAARAAPAMVAEGFARFTTADTIRYLRMARGELAEVQNHIEAGRRRNYFSEEKHSSIETLARRAMGTTTNYLKAKIKQRQQELKEKRTRA